MVLCHYQMALCHGAVLKPSPQGQEYNSGGQKEEHELLPPDTKEMKFIGCRGLAVLRN